jgi:hypothetical protein
MSEVTPERRKTDMHVRITQIGGKLPNLALMTISAYHRSVAMRSISSGM